MTDQSFMIFELKEKIRHFKGGQSFNNLASLELEPIVKVLETKKNVEITGYLILNGEFLKQAEDWNEHFEQSDGIHYDTLFTENEEQEIGTFQYQIPVSFQIEPERIEDISQVFINVEDFDYIPLNDDEMELTAKIKLVGVHPAISQDNPVDFAYEPVEYSNDEFYFNKSYLLNNYQDDVEEKIEPIDFEDEEVYPTKFDFEEQKNVQTQSYEQNEPIQFENRESNLEPPNDLSDDNKTAMKIGIKGKKSEEKQQETTTFNTIYSLLKKEKKTIEKDHFSTTHEAENDEPNEVIEYTEETNQEEDVEIAISEAPELDQKSFTKTKEYLFSLVKEDEVNNYKLKIYLVQKQDTLESIAEKYNVTVNNVISSNNLESTDIYEGQLLYIPRKG